MTEIREITPVDEVEAAIAKLPEAIMPLVHSFTPGLYIRQIFMPAGTILTSMRHLTEHPFIVISGMIEVLDQEDKSVFIGPYMGVTKAGTKRVLYAHTDTLWMTIHANPENLTEPDEIVSKITAESDNPLLDKSNPRANAWKTSVSPSIVFDGNTQRKELIK